MLPKSEHLGPMLSATDEEMEIRKMRELAISFTKEWLKLATLKPTLPSRLKFSKLFWCVNDNHEPMQYRSVTTLVPSECFSVLYC